jgi:hypothetical protein
MRHQSGSATAKSMRPSVIRETTEGLAAKALEVNIIFTNEQATAAALKAAGALALDLGVCLRVRAAIAVPYALPLDRPLVPVRITEHLLSDLVGRMEHPGLESTINLYLCRNRLQTLSRVLPSNSVVVIGGRKHWFPTAESRMAKTLRSQGHRVVFIDAKKGTRWDPQ